jgi:hypothetical protein
LLFFDHFIEQVYELIHDKTIEKQKGSHRIAAQIIAGIIRGSKYWTLDMVKITIILYLSAFYIQFS